MSAEQKVGQLLIFGFRGTRMGKSVTKTLTEVQPGGLILFGHNIEGYLEVAQLNQELQDFMREQTGTPLLLMLDQEGGNVSRLGNQPPFLSAMAMGQTLSTRLAYAYGKQKGELLASLGFNMNLAPVLDLSSPQKVSFIGERSFGDTPDLVAHQTLAYSKGLLSQSIIPTGKHFPGHGAVTQDSHHTLPAKNISLEELMNHDLVPFLKFSQGLKSSAVMMAHVSYPQIDPSGAPASYSSIMVQDILRDQLGYQGLVITDDLEMQGAGVISDIGERAIKAIEAGCDMVMVGWTRSQQRRAFQGLLDAHRSGRISQERLDQSVRRILRAKNSFPPSTVKLAQSNPNRLETLKAHLDRVESLNHLVLRWHLLQSRHNLPSQTDLHSMSQGTVSLISADSFFFDAFESSFKGQTNRVLLSPHSPQRSLQSLSQQPSSLHIFNVTGLGSLRLLQRLSPKEKKQTLVINSLYPGVLQNRDQYLGILDLHSHHPLSGRWVAELLQNPDLLALRIPNHRQSPQP